jgi:hypothetical protein
VTPNVSGAFSTSPATLSDSISNRKRSPRRLFASKQ